MSRIEYDVVVVGSGVAGSSAAAEAARCGARVLLLEKSATFGGSAALSAGMFWTAPDLAAYRNRIPLGNQELGARLVSDYPAAVEQVRSLGVRVAEEATTDIMTFGVGYSCDIHGVLDASRGVVVAAGGTVLADAPVLGLLVEDDRVVGVRARIDGRAEEVRSLAVVLATGGFGRDPELLTRYLGRHADRIKRRSHPGNVGDGLRMARAAGAGGSAAMSSFYGHLLPWPLEHFEAADYLPYSQYYSGETVLVNLRGERFVDETLGDEILNQELVAQPEARGVLVFDDRVRANAGSDEPFPGLGSIDRFEIARQAGGRWASESTLSALIRKVAGWGVDGEALAATLNAYERAARAGAGSAGGAPVADTAVFPSHAPFHALMVQPSVTFTFGGVPISPDGEALDPDGRVIPGLFAAGADIGGLSNIGYAGGLAPGYVTGRWAGATAAGQRRNAERG